MQAIQNFFEHRSIFQRFADDNRPFLGPHLCEYQFFKTEKIAKGKEVNIDFEVDLFYEVRPFIFRVISECKNHSHRAFSYQETLFEVFLVPDNGGSRISLIWRIVKNDQPFR